MTDIHTQLANVLRDHSEVWDGFTQRYVCTCDTWTGDDLGHYWNHVADVLLSLPGIAIVELPEADANGEFEGGRVWINPLTGFVRFLAAQFQPKQARRIAAALLAAAAAAEREAK